MYEQGKFLKDWLTIPGILLAEISACSHLHPWITCPHPVQRNCKTNVFGSQVWYAQLHLKDPDRRQLQPAKPGFRKLRGNMESCIPAMEIFWLLWGLCHTCVSYCQTEIPTVYCGLSFCLEELHSPLQKNPVAFLKLFQLFETKLHFILLHSSSTVAWRIPTFQTECCFSGFFPYIHNSSYWPLSHSSQKNLGLLMLKNSHNHQYFNKTEKQMTQISPEHWC